MSQNKKKGQQEAQTAFRKAGPYLQIGYAILGAVVLFGLLGYWLDAYWQTEPWGLIGGVFLGFFLGLYRMIKVINQMERE